MSEPGSADLQKQLGEMRAEFLKGLTSLKDDQVAGLREVAGELGKVQLRLVAVEASMSEQAEIKTELKELRDKVSELELWKAGFTGEKGERDKNSDNNAAFWRRIAGGLLGALILAVAGALFQSWQASQTQQGLTKEDITLILQAVEESRDADPDGH